ncbi:SRA stem-loop-interacting RNA-binding protein, mitochondrial-like [Diadema setosum]|uniref:SRA stem-loop-interacting RNA-binding protein, mitochondrial-like n=1 Tax=Diadema setosum TaxID=31175 RepID=UPI003B3A8E4D
MAAKKSLEVFVSRLPWTVGAQELREHFSRFGAVKNCRVAFDYSTGFSKGFGFVVFGNPNGLQNALKHEEHRLDGQQINIQAKQKSPDAARKLQIADIIENDSGQ